MRRYGLGMLAIVSLLIALVAGMGYFGRFQVQVHPAMTSYELTAAEGAIFISRTTAPATAWDDTERTFAWGFSPDWPSIRRGGWHFSRGSQDTVFSGRVILNRQWITFPSWCLLLPCSVAPLMWLRRRRKQKTRGFPVEPAVIAQ